jgi:hypothetical protein
MAFSESSLPISLGLFINSNISLHFFLIHFFLGGGGNGRGTKAIFGPLKKLGRASGPCAIAIKHELWILNYLSHEII